MSSGLERPPAPLVSVITPTFNMGRRLERCLESVRDQTYGSIEHIVIDGGSTDETVEILRTSDVRWISEPDEGQSDAINKGLRMATGEILGWLNADDELVPNALEQVVSALSRNPDAGLAYGDIEQVEDGLGIRVRPSPVFSLETLWRGNVISQPGTFWTKWAQDRNGLIDEDFHLTMDYELWLRFAKNGVPAIYVPEVLARFVVHAESKTGSQSTLAFAEEEARALRKHGEIHGAAMAIDRWYFDDVRRILTDLLASRQFGAASRQAATALPRMHPLSSRLRWFLWLTRIAPRLAAFAVRRVDGRPLR